MTNISQNDPPPPSDLPRAIASGPLTLAGETIESHVLSDERRVLDTTQAQAFLGSASKNRMFDRFVARIINHNNNIQAHPRIAFQRPDGRSLAYGYEAGFIMDLCLAYQRAFIAGQLHHKQQQIAMRAMTIVAAAAKVGLVALVDEATGYQGQRSDGYLQRRLDEFLREECDKWKARWTDNLMGAICRLYRKPYVPGAPPPKFMQRIEGMIYDILIGEAVMAKLRRRNPAPSRGTNHHQFLQERVQAMLEREIDIIAALAGTSTDKRQFWHRMNVHYRKHPLQLDLN